MPVDRKRIDRLLEENLANLRAFLRVRAGAELRARSSSSELVQSVCREVLESADRIEFQGDAAFRGWLYRAALHKIIEHHRRQGAMKRDARQEVPIDDEGVDGAVLKGYASATTPSMLAMGREGAAKLEEAFDELSEEQREIITMARFVGLSHAEIAAQLGTSAEVCRQRLRRALVKLSMALAARGIQM